MISPTEEECMVNRAVILSICVIVCCFFTATNILAQTMVIRYPTGRNSKDHRYEYMVKVLELILNKTVDSHVPYRLKPSLGMNQERMIQYLIHGKLDVAQLPISTKADQSLLPIRVPIRKGLLGWRILLIRKEDQEAFAQVEAMADLQKFRAGFGRTWSDLPILEFNIGADKVIKGESYDGLFGMLINNRFDYLHRAIHEPWDEVAERKDQYPDLKIEDTIVLHYPIGDYLYVNPQNFVLAERLQKGFDIALSDGTFEQLFQQEFSEIIDKAKILQRTLIKLRNPYLPKETPVGNTSLWLSF